MKKRCTYGAGIFIFYCFTIGMSLYHHFHYLKMMCVMLLMWRKCGFAFCIALAHCYLNRISLRYTTKYIFLIDILLIWIKIFNFIDIFWFEFLITKLLDGLVEQLHINSRSYYINICLRTKLMMKKWQTTAQIYSYHWQWNSFKNSKNIMCR